MTTASENPTDAPPPDPLTEVVARMRARAAQARRGARIFLAGLVVTVISGLAFYLLLPFWENFVDARRATLDATLDEISLGDRDLDAARDALIHRRGDPPGLAEALLGQWEADPQGMPSPPLGHVVMDDTVLIYGHGGMVLRSTDGGDSFAPVATRTTETLRGHALMPDGSLVLYGTGGTVLRSTDAGANLSSVATATDLQITRHLTPYNTLLLYGSGNAILRSTNSGASFATIPLRQRVELVGHIQLADAILLYGNSGALLRSTDGGASFSPVSVGGSSGLRIHFVGHVTLGETVLLFDSLGRVLRSTNAGASFEQLVTPPNWIPRGTIPVGDEALIYGTSGIVLRAGPDGTVSPAPIPTETDAALNIHLDLDGTLLIFGAGNTILRSTNNGRSFTTVSIDGFGLIRGHAVLDDSLLVFSESGNVLRSRDRGASFTQVHEGPGTGAGRGWYRHTTLGDTVILYGSEGSLLRSTNRGDSFVPVPSGTGEALRSHVMTDDRLILLGQRAAILRPTDRWSDEAAALSLAAGVDGDTTLAAFLDATLPAHIRDQDSLSALRAELTAIENRRASLAFLRDGTEERLRALDGFPYAQWRRDRVRLDLESFMATCRGPDGYAADITSACLEAWQVQQQSGEAWWQTLSEKIPPGILILFLLATTGALYRYNLRLAGFHDSRADALDLLARGRGMEELRDVLAASPDKALNLATVFLAADKVEMGAIKAKLGQAEVEIAKALRSDR